MNYHTQNHQMGTRSRVGRAGAAVAAAAALTAGLGAGDAFANDVAYCRVQAHMSFGVGEPQGGIIDCKGLLGDSTVTSAGEFDILKAPAFTGAVGPYGGLSGAPDTSTIQFDATLPRLVDFSPPGQNGVHVDGSLRLGRVGSALVVTGRGHASRHQLSYHGTGQFARDSVPPQGGEESGELTLDIAVSQTGEDAPASGDQRTDATDATRAPRASHRNHHHRRAHGRHRRARRHHRA